MRVKEVTTSPDPLSVNASPDLYVVVQVLYRLHSIVLDLTFYGIVFFLNMFECCVFESQLPRGTEKCHS